MITTVGTLIPVLPSLSENQCWFGQWKLQNVDSNGTVTYGHPVTYDITTGASYLSFNNDGTGSLVFRELELVTQYGPDPEGVEWAPIAGRFNGVKTFSYTVNDDPTGSTRIAYTEGKGDIEISTSGDYVPSEKRTPPVWLTDNYVTCGNESITLRVPGENRMDVYVLDK